MSFDLQYLIQFCATLAVEDGWGREQTFKPLDRKSIAKAAKHTSDSIAAAHNGSVSIWEFMEKYKCSLLKAELESIAELLVRLNL